MAEEARKKVLVVDDEEHIRTILRRTLELVYEVDTAGDGKEGMGKLDDVYAVFTDLNMPVMDGAAFIKEARDKMKYRGAAFLMSTTSEEEALEYLAEHGIPRKEFPQYFNGFVRKPFSDIMVVPRMVAEYKPQ